MRVPDAPELDDSKLPPAPYDERRRPAVERRLDGGIKLDEAFRAIDQVIEPVHDVAISLFQDWLDHIAGKACPSLDDNVRLAAMITERADSYGFRLFVERKVGLVQVKIEAKPARGNPSGRTAMAGVFAIRAYNPDRRATVTLSEVAAFPQCIAARDLEQANRIWEERKRLGS